MGAISTRKLRKELQEWLRPISPLISTNDDDGDVATGDTIAIAGSMTPPENCRMVRLVPAERANWGSMEPPAYSLIARGADVGLAVPCQMSGCLLTAACTLRNCCADAADLKRCILRSRRRTT